MPYTTNSLKAILASSMAFSFSQQLRNDLIAYLLKKHALEVSQEEADEYLHSMADWYCSASENHRCDREPASLMKKVSLET